MKFTKSSDSSATGPADWFTGTVRIDGVRRPDEQYAIGCAYKPSILNSLGAFAAMKGAWLSQVCVGPDFQIAYVATDSGNRTAGFVMARCGA